MVHSVHCMMGLDSLPSSTHGEEMSVEEQVERLFVVRQYCSAHWSDVEVKYSALLWGIVT